MSRTTNSPNPIHLLLVDDHPLLRKGLQSLVGSSGEFHIIGEAADGEQACELAQGLQPDIILMDIEMPKMNGIDATRWIKTALPHIIVIGLSINQSAVVNTMKAAGASAYLTKDTAPEDFWHVTRSTLTQHTYNFPGLLAGCLVMVALLSMMNCTRLPPIDQKYYSSRVYALPYERVFNAVHARVAEYPMGMGEADQTDGIVKSRIGGTMPGSGATVGYQVTVVVSQVGKQTRVTPDWQMNVSSEPTKTHLVPVSIDERPRLYIEFFEELDKYFKN